MFELPVRILVIDKNGDFEEHNAINFSFIAKAVKEKIENICKQNDINLEVKNLTLRGQPTQYDKGFAFLLNSDEEYGRLIDIIESIEG